VAGSAIFGSRDYAKTIQEMRRQIATGPASAVNPRARRARS